MISDEYMMKAACRMQDAADRSNAAADRMEAAAHRIALLLEDGYGGNGLRLIEILENKNIELKPITVHFADWNELPRIIRKGSKSAANLHLIDAAPHRFIYYPNGEATDLVGMPVVSKEDFE